MKTSKSIVLTRIDNRLIHGQIVGEWAGCVGANLLVVVDDEVAANEVEKSVMSIAAQSLGLDSRFFTIEQTINTIHKASSSQKILLICKTPATLRKLIDGGVNIDIVNIGNMHFSEGKKSISEKVYVDDKDLDDLNYIKSKVKEIYIRDTPNSKKEKF